MTVQQITGIIANTGGTPGHPTLVTTTPTNTGDTTTTGSPNGLSALTLLPVSAATTPP